jgi:hypothetical protein
MAVAAVDGLSLDFLSAKWTLLHGPSFISPYAVLIKIGIA